MKKLKDFVLLVKTELIICIAVPILTAVLVNTSATQHKDAFLFTVVGLFCVFAYGIVKMFFTLKKKRIILNEENVSKPKSTKYRIFIFITAIVMPVAGLTLNISVDGIVGNFSNIWFYIIAILNGLVMLVDIKSSKLGLALFYAKIIGFTYIAYFTIVFIPVLPFGFVGLIFYGLGVLIFAPITIFVTELFQILRDSGKLKAKFRYGVIAAVVLGVVTIPAVLAANFTIDRINFNNALTYLSAGSAKMPAVNISRLETSLTHISNVLGTRQDRGMFSNGTNTPIITKLYQVVALDDKILSPDTSHRLSQIFLGRADNQPINADRGQLQNVNLVNAGASTEFDEKVYKTWVDLEMKNDGLPMAEYRTEFLLPDGCFIKDYYLYVGNDRKQGILADKRAALITYNNIIRTPKDPGIIYYKSNNVVELRVYPFHTNQIRKTGFWVWHTQSETINIDGWEISLTAENSRTEPIDMQGVSFIPASYKENLPPLDRAPKYYFVIDASKDSPYNEHLKKVQDFSHEITNREIYAASYQAWNIDSAKGKHEGGFNLPLAMETIFMDVEENGDDFYPVIIVVSDNIGKAPDFQKSNMARQYPESEYYYNLGYDLSLTPYSFADNKRHDIVKSPILTGTLGYNGFAVADNDKSEIIISGDFGDYTDNEYQNAFLLQGKSSLYDNDNSTQIELVRDSFRQRVLTKYTAFTVLETREQENALLELQAKFLNNDGKDAPAVMMDEPGLLICLIMGFMLVVYKRKTTLRHNPSSPQSRRLQ